MGTKIKDKKFLWLTVLHIFEDKKVFGAKTINPLHEAIDELYQKFDIKEKSNKPAPKTSRKNLLK